MKHFYLKSLLCMVMMLVGVNAWGEDVTYLHSFTAKPSTGNNITLSGVNWNIAATNLGSYNSQNYAGVQFGSGGNTAKSGSITLTSASSWNYTKDEKTGKIIKEVHVWLNTGGSDGQVTASVTIGGKAATSDGTVVKKNSSAGSDYTKASKITFTPANDGKQGVVVINATTGSNKIAGYICAIEIVAEEEVLGTAYNLTLNSVTNGTISATVDGVAAGATVNAGKLVTITATPASGYDLSSWSVTGATPSSNTTTVATFTMPDNDVTVGATFALHEVHAGTYNIDLNNSFWGTEYTGQISSLSKGNLNLNGSSNDVSINAVNTNSTSGYVNDNQTRFYNGYDLTITAPTGYYITNVVFIEPSTSPKWDADPTASVGTFVSSTKSWVGTNNSVKFTFSGTCKVTGVTVTYANSETITISAAKYATYYNSGVAYTMPSDCKGYIWNNGLVETYAANAVVPAGEALVIYSETAGTKSLVFTTTSNAKSANNALLGTDTETALTADDNYYFYGLSLNAAGETSSVGFYWMAADGAAFNNGAHKAYLKLAKTSGAPSYFIFSDNDENGSENAISNINAEENAAECYDLMGRKSNGKGLMISNGKVMIVK